MSNQPDHTLIIHFHSEEWLLSVCDKENKLISTKKIPVFLPVLSEDEIVQIIAKEPDMQKQYAKVRFVCETDFYTFVPTAIFQEKEANDLFYLLFEKNKNAVVLFNVLNNWEMVNIFSIPLTLHKALMHFYPQPVIEHHLAYYLNNIIKQPTNNRLHVWIANRKLDIIAFKNGTIELINRFDYQTSEDFVYHLLNVFEQLSLDVENCKVQLYNTEQKGELLAMIRKYVNVINMPIC